MKCKTCNGEYNIKAIIHQFGDVYWKNDYCCPFCYTTALIKNENEICVGDFVMVPSMQCTIYKVTEIIENPGDKEKRYMVRTPMKVMEGTKIKELQFCGNEFRESEVIKIKNW